MSEFVAENIIELENWFEATKCTEYMKYFNDYVYKVQLLLNIKRYGLEVSVLWEMIRNFL